MINGSGKTMAMRKCRRKGTGREPGGVSFDTVREIASELPGAVEGTSYGTPAFHIGKTLFVRQHQDGESLVIRIEPAERALLVSANPKTYSVTDHYVNYPLILVRMASVGRKELRELLTEAWRLGGAINPGGRRRTESSSADSTA
jgi:hypothetical protein